MCTTNTCQMYGVLQFCFLISWTDVYTYRCWDHYQKALKEGNIRLYIECTDLQTQMGLCRGDNIRVDVWLWIWFTSWRAAMRVMRKLFMIEQYYRAYSMKSLILFDTFCIFIKEILQLQTKSSLYILNYRHLFRFRLFTLICVQFQIFVYIRSILIHNSSWILRYCCTIKSWMNVGKT